MDRLQTVAYYLLQLLANLQLLCDPFMPSFSSSIRGIVFICWFLTGFLFNFLEQLKCEQFSLKPSFQICLPIDHVLGEPIVLVPRLKTTEVTKKTSFLF